MYVGSQRDLKTGVLSYKKQCLTFFRPKPLQDIEIKHFFRKNLILPHFRRHTGATGRTWQT